MGAGLMHDNFSPAGSGYLLDASVLIDYIDSDRFVLELLAKHITQLVVATPVLEEVKSVSSPEELLDLGIDLVEPELEDILKAGEGSGALSFQDRLCLILADRLKLVCLTNDKLLRKVCLQQKIETQWGLKPLALLVERRKLAAHTAWGIAQQIQEINPRDINDEVLRRFKTIIQLPKDVK